jgi:hypothetical protein
MPLIPPEVLPYFENVIYFPMIINVLVRDRVTIENGPFKLKGPYLKLIDGALEFVRAESKETNIYLLRNSMKVINGKNDGTFTEYIYISGAYEDHRRYLNVRLRNRTEELISVYFSKVGI